MNCVVIDSQLFNPNINESGGIVTALKSIMNAGYVIIVHEYEKKVSDQIKKIISGEELNPLENIPAEAKIIFELTTNKLDKPETIYINSAGVYKNIGSAVELIMKQERIVSRKRKTKETLIEVDLNLDGLGKSEIKTGLGFFDHMLEQIARHGNVDLKINVKGDLHVDEHHTIEDTGIAIGEAVLEALGDKSGIKRYGYFLPMDDTIAKFAMDIGGRQYLNFKCKFEREKVGDFPTELTEEFFKGVAQGLKANIFIRAKGKNDHHKIEAIFKAFAKSLNEACRIDYRTKGNVPSTKGII
ncbi:MAG: imidazoleglycerol-phosphate dehydratase HisB [Ignavibacteriae bacterium HGW-Ignavibacteriae-2]|jgi:imidazoleglycerol-phosphate dehydratase/histidinol-phosphatase|nr:MAG: imidazoleglycerol-phosphate dehydratase HisB [Ignavibacteriae bacterium HGW-Ignavibacteriae-2]